MSMGGMASMGGGGDLSAQMAQMQQVSVLT